MKPIVKRIKFCKFSVQKACLWHGESEEKIIFYIPFYIEQ